MAVVKGWTEHPPSKILSSSMDNVLFPLLAPQKEKRAGATKVHCITGSTEEQAATWMTTLTRTNWLLKDSLLFPFRLLLHRCLQRGFLLESEAVRAQIRDHRTGAWHLHPQKPRRGKSYTGSTVRHARQGTRLRSLTQNLRLLLIHKRYQLAACFSQQLQPAPPQHPSASVVDVKVESLVA